VLSVKAAETAGKEKEFTNQMTEIAVLGVLVLLLGFTVWLLRIKEREPEEGRSDQERADEERAGRR
jgi:hypothetical protein